MAAFLFVQLSVYKAIVSYLDAQEGTSSPSPPAADPSHVWRQKLSLLLETHPQLATEEGSQEEEEEEDSQGLPRDLCKNVPEEVDFSLSSSEGEGEEEEGVARGVVIPERSSRGAAIMRKKSKVCSAQWLQ